jgi:hypothetical protein
MFPNAPKIQDSEPLSAYFQSIEFRLFRADDYVALD